MTIKDAFNRLQNEDHVYMIFNTNSIVPYVRCDTDDTMLDYASLYFSEEMALADAKALTAEGLGPKTAMKINKDQIVSVLIDTLYLGIDAIKFNLEEESMIIETEQMVRIDPNVKSPDGKPYLINRPAQISMVYLVQELMKRPDSPKRDPQLLNEYQTEALRDIANSSFYVAFTELKDKAPAAAAEDTAENAGSSDNAASGTDTGAATDNNAATADADGKSDESGSEHVKKFVPAVLKDKEGRLMLPIFTDINELKKAFRGQPEQKVPYRAMPYREIVAAFINDKAKLDGIIVNPAGVKLPMLKKSVQTLAADKRFIPEEK